jgi:hypothetical protein
MWIRELFQKLEPENDFFEVPQKKIGRPTVLITRKQLGDAVAICQLDLGKQGKIYRTVYLFHGKVKLAYLWHGIKDGARIKCLMEGCKFTTHFEGLMHHPGFMLETCARSKLARF